MLQDHYLLNLTRKTCLLTLILSSLAFSLLASSHREAPLISNDPLADNTDLYAFRSPDNPDMITIIANYIPAELPYGGPNYFSFGRTYGMRSISIITYPPPAMTSFTASLSSKSMKILLHSSISGLVFKT
jgi:hypothetical protein